MPIQAKDLYKDIILPNRESTFRKAGLTLDVEAGQILDHTQLGPSVPEGAEKPRKEAILPSTASTKAPMRNAGESSPEPDLSDSESDTSSSSGCKADAAEAEALTEYLEYENTQMVAGASDS